jgi:hypothetical protein
LGALVGVSLGCAAIGHAAEIDYMFSAGVGYSDNVERTATDEIGTGAAIVGVELLGRRPAGRFRYDLAGDVAYYEYFDSAVEGLTLGSMAARGSYDIVPEAFAWRAEASYDQIRSSLLRPAAPSNLDDVITLSTGPTLRARFGDAFDAMLEGRFTRTDFSDRAFDSDTIGATLVLGRSMSARSLVGIGASFDDVTYESQIGLADADFERREAFIRFRAAGMRTSLELDGGYAEVSGTNIDDSGPMLRVRATRRLTPFISGFLSYTQEFPTSEDAIFSADPSFAGSVSTDASVLTAAPRDAKSAGLGLALTRPRTFGELAYFRRRETALVSGFGNREYDNVIARVTRVFTPRTSAGLIAEFSKEQLSGAAVDTDEYSIGGHFTLNFGRSLGLEIRVESRDRDGRLFADRYSELSGGVFLRYGRMPPGSRTRVVDPNMR